MGDGSGGSAASANATPFQMELLMERLRTKTSPHKSLVDTSKAVRMTMLDKRWALDSGDRAQLQRCLDTLQQRIEVASLPGLVERLDCLARHLGLKFTASADNLFISSEMFYLEILLDDSTVRDVKIHHEGKSEQQSCAELVACIARGDFADFTTQLEGLMSVYQLNAQKNVKCNAFSALTALETDLATLSQLQASFKEPWPQIHKSPVGLVHKRRGGHALRLTYFVSPYEVAKLPGGILTAEALAKGAGLSALVSLETSTAHRLQLTPLVQTSQRVNSPMYAPLSPSNSASLPARFILKLSHPMPVSGALLKTMNAAGESDANPVMSPNASSPPAAATEPMLGLIVRHTSADANPNKGLFVTLPDQSQCYFLTETNGLDGSIVESIPFTHPRQVPALIACLRQQALFNTLISNCIRPNSKQDVEASIMIELNALSCQHIMVSLEQPGESGMATLEIEIPEGGGSPHVSLQGVFDNNEIYEEYLGRVLQRTLSIPLTVRALLARWERDSRPGFSGGAEGLDADGPPTSPRPHYSHSTQNNFSNESHHNMQLFNSQDAITSIIGNNNSYNLQNSTVSQSEDKKSTKKRKSEYSSGSPSKKNKPQLCEVYIESGSSDSGSESDSEMEDENVQSNSSNDEDDDEPHGSPVSQTDFVSDLEISGLDSTELIGGSSNDNKTSCSEFENSGDGETNELQEMDEIIRASSATSTFDTKKHKQKSREYRDHRTSKISNSNLLMELEGAGYMAPSVSITPITSSSNPSTSSPQPSPSFSAALTSMGLDKRPGIEIIPISNNQQTSLSSSLTIIPLPSHSKSIDNRHRSDRKSSSSKTRTGSSDRSKDKKKKRRRDDSMGPPEKLPPKSDPLTKPVSVSIKPTDRSHSPISVRSSSPNSLMRKFSPSPTHGRSVSISKSSIGSPSYSKNLNKSSGSSSHHNSPRHSPIQCSPKHTLAGYSSPKNHGISSPKHNSTSGSSGKPSMSTLKSATSSSPSGKSGSSNYDISKLSKSASKECSLSISSSSKEKERKSGSISYSSSSGSSSPKLKSSSVKLKQLDLSVTPVESPNISSANENIITPIVDLSKAATANQVRNRKGSLSAVIDKLKSAQYCGSEPDMTGKSLSTNKDRPNSSSSKQVDSKNNATSISKIGEGNKTQEYMVKPSSDGMKITINKTRTKDSNSSGVKSSSFMGTTGSNSSGASVKQSPNVNSASGTGSPKTHTGLKPGVISGPASKKPLALQSSKSGMSFGSSSSSSSQMGSISSKGSPSGSMGGNSKSLFTKSNSGSSLSNSMNPKSSKNFSGSPKMSSSASDLSKVSRDREKSRSSKSGLSGSSSSDKSIFASNKSNEKRLSPAPTRDDPDVERNFKMQSQHGKEQNFTVEGLIKSLDTSKYQIPKLSARFSGEDGNKVKNTQNAEKSVTVSSSQSDLSITKTGDSTAKMLEYMGRDLSSKYSFQQLSNAKMSEQTQKSQSSLLPPVSKSAISITSIGTKVQSNPIPLLTAPKSSESDASSSNFVFGNVMKAVSESSKENKSGESRSNPATSPVDDSFVKSDFSKSFPNVTLSCNESGSKSLDSSGSKLFSNIQKSCMDESRKMHVDSQSSVVKSHSDPNDILLDFSSSSTSSSNMKSSELKSKIASLCLGGAPGNPRRRTPPLAAAVSQTPSLSVHIVKSPAPSPMLILSPHSNSPCITDDDLMDEAVVGPGK